MLQTTLHDYDGVTVVAPRGDIDAEVAFEFRQVMTQALERGAHLLLVDMADVRFLDSAGLAVLVGTHRHLAAGQRLALGNVPPRMQRVLHETAMNKLMDIHAAGDPWPWPEVPARPAS